MMKWSRVLALGIGAVLLTLGAPRVEAKEHGGKEHGGKEHGGQRHAGGAAAHPENPPGFEKGKKEGWKKKGTTRPPGWEKGKKKGWEGKSQPPGQTQ